MALYKVVILAVIQGITEFLPISSSGHLALMQMFFSNQHVDVSLDIFLHFGTLLSIFVFFFSDMKNILMSFLNKEKKYVNLVIGVIIATIPTGIIGLFIKRYIDVLSSSMLFIAIMLFITGLLLYIGQNYIEKQVSNKENLKKLEDITLLDSLIIGIVQGFAVLPGISRSGSTIVASLFKKIEKTDAATFSFYIALPALFGAGLLEIKHIFFSNAVVHINYFNYFIGFIVSFIVGLISIKVLMEVIKKYSLKIFAYYCFFISVFLVLKVLIFK